MDTSAFAVRYLSLNETEYIDGGITQTVLDKMVRMIRGGTVREVYLSMSEYGGGDDEDFLNVDLAHGWAGPAFSYWDEEGEAHMLLPVNSKYSGGESAPVEIGGQTPVLKRNALDDLDLAAECVLHFARTGTLYPGLEWEEFE